MEQPSLLIPVEPARVSPSVNRTWLRTVAISWSAGLAAGLLISILWTRWTNNGIANKGSQSPANGQLSQPNLSATPSLESPIASRPNDSVPPQERNRSRYESMQNSSYLTAFDSSDQSILRPFVPLRSVDWEAAMVDTKTRQHGTGAQSLENPQGKDVPSSNSALNSIPIPFERPRSQGQHQWLKSLMKSEEFGSESTT
jgi:hypothetical protein